MLENFKTYLPTSGEVTATLTKNGLGISKAAISKLNQCKYVKLMFDYTGRRMAILPTNENDPARMEFARNDSNVGIRWNSRDLVRTIANMNAWPIENGERYMVQGDFLPDEEALIFEFDKAERT